MHALHTRAISYALLSAFLLSLNAVFSRLAGQDVGLAEVMFALAFFVHLINIFNARLVRPRVILTVSKYPSRQLLRAVLNAVATVFNLYGLFHLPLSTYMLLGFLAPCLVAVLGWLMQQEKPGKLTWASMALGMVGVAFILPYSGGDWLPLSSLLVSVVIGSFNPLLVRSMPEDHPFVFSFYTCLTNMTLTGAWILFQGVKGSPSPEFYGLMLAAAAVVALSNYLYFRSNQTAAPQVSAPAIYSSLVWGTLFGWLVWQEWPAGDFWLGMPFILASSSLLLVPKAIQAFRARVEQ